MRDLIITNDSSQFSCEMKSPSPSKSARVRQDGNVLTLRYIVMAETKVQFFPECLEFVTNDAVNWLPTLFTVSLFVFFFFPVSFSAFYKREKSVDMSTGKKKKKKLKFQQIFPPAVGSVTIVYFDLVGFTHVYGFTLSAFSCIRWRV